MYADIKPTFQVAAKKPERDVFRVLMVNVGQIDSMVKVYIFYIRLFKPKVLIGPNLLNRFLCWPHVKMYLKKTFYTNC